MSMKTCKVNGRWDIVLPDYRADRPEWHTESGWEKKRLDHMHDHLTKEDTLFYVGAEEGDMSALCSMWGVKDLVLFEPNPLVFPNIRAIFEHNNLDTPYTFVGFASNLTTVKPPSIKKGWESCAYGEMIKDHGFMELRNRNAPEIRIDDVPMTPTALSIDVEGAEWQVLRGARKTLEKYHPKIWLSLHPEFMYEHFGEYAFDLRNWLKDLGYKETLLDYQHEVHLYYEKN